MIKINITEDDNGVFCVEVTSTKNGTIIIFYVTETEAKHMANSHEKDVLLYLAHYDLKTFAEYLKKLNVNPLTIDRVEFDRSINNLIHYSIINGIGVIHLLDFTITAIDGVIHVIYNDTLMYTISKYEECNQIISLYDFEEFCF